jgi:glycosyltransferase involved in cell wall biosynthesis
VKVIITRPTERIGFELNYSTNGSYLGIEYEYSTESVIWPDNKILKLKEQFLGSVKTVMKILKEHKTRKIDLIISAATYTFSENLPFYLLAKTLRLKLVLTIDEYPWVIIHKKNYTLFYRWIYLTFYYKLFDGFIVMTKTLRTYYCKLAKKRAEFVHIPMTVEIDRFNIIPEPPKEKYIAYCGGRAGDNIDGIDILVKAFNLIKNEFPDLKLYIAGKTSESTVKLIESLSLSKRAVLIGFIERDLVPEFLMNSRVLCLARKANVQAEGGFPTKLGEYLASGRPTIITKVGELSDYVSDGVSTFFVKPGDVLDFADKLRFVLANEALSSKVGVEGKKIALDIFSYKNHSNALDAFVNVCVDKAK